MGKQKASGLLVIDRLGVTVLEAFFRLCSSWDWFLPALVWLGGDEAGQAARQVDELEDGGALTW